jgi:hypothetical protein
MGIVGQNKMLTYESIPEIAIEGDFMETEVHTCIQYGIICDIRKYMCNT